MVQNKFGNDVFAQMYEAVEDRLEEIATEATSIMKSVINKKTGALRDSVQMEKAKDGSYLVGVNEQILINDKRNAGHVNYVSYYYNGSKPHTIRAKNAKALHWVLNGKDYYAKSVHHPGNKPHDFIQDTVRLLDK